MAGSASIEAECSWSCSLCSPLSTLSLAVANSSACCGREHLHGPGNLTQQLLCVLPPCQRAWVRAPGRQTAMGPSMGEEGVARSVARAGTEPVVEGSQWVNVLQAGVPALAPFLSAWFLLASVSLAVYNFLSWFPLRCG